MTIVLYFLSLNHLLCIDFMQFMDFSLSPLLICMRFYCLLAACVLCQNKHISAARYWLSVQLLMILLRVWNVFELISHLCRFLQKSCQAGSWTWPRWPSQRLVRSRSFRRFWRPSTSCWGPTAGPSSGVWTVSITSTSVTSMLKLTLQEVLVLHLN